MTPDQIIAATAEAFGVQPDDLLSTCGSGNGRRALVLMLRRFLPQMTNLEIAKMIGAAGNASVANMLVRGRRQMETDQAWATAVKRLGRRLSCPNTSETISEAMEREQARAAAEIVVPLKDGPVRQPDSVDFIRSQMGRMSDAAMMRSLGIRRESDFPAALRAGEEQVMGVEILIGDVREQLRQLEPDSIDCVVTSPPYWGLRDYGVAGQIGMEPSWADHLAVMLDVFREVRRVIKPQATVWLNYGDGYATHPNGRKASEVKALGKDDRTFRDKPMSTVGGTFKAKDLLMMPNRLAIALQDDGWWVRAECIWGKPNPMPDSSGRFRPATAHEKIFLLGKTGSLYYDAEAVKKPVAESSAARYRQDIEAQQGSARANAGGKTNGRMKAVGGPRTVDKRRGHSRRHAGFNERWDAKEKGVPPRHQNLDSNHRTLADTPRVQGRLLRNYEPEIWHIPPVGFDEAHFATFPPALAQRCIMAGCPAGGLVLDPFGGAGTVGMVAAQLGRSAVLIELNPEYAALAQKRIEAAAQVRVEGGIQITRQELPLFGEVA